MSWLLYAYTAFVKQWNEMTEEERAALSAAAAKRRAESQEWCRRESERLNTPA